MASASPRDGRAGDGSPTTAAASTRLRHSSRFVSEDLNVRCSGHIVEHKEPGKIDGIRLELDDEDQDAITVVSFSPPLVGRRRADDHRPVNRRPS